MATVTELYMGNMRLVAEIDKITAERDQFKAQYEELLDSAEQVSKELLDTSCELVKSRIEVSKMQKVVEAARNLRTVTLKYAYRNTLEAKACMDLILALSELEQHN